MVPSKRGSLKKANKMLSLKASHPGALLNGLPHVNLSGEVQFFEVTFLIFIFFSLLNLVPHPAMIFLESLLVGSQGLYKVLEIESKSAAFKVSAADCTTSLCSTPIFKEKVGCLEIPCAICSLGNRGLKSLEGGSGKDGVMSKEALGWKCKSILTVILRKLFYSPSLFFLI